MFFHSTLSKYWCIQPEFLYSGEGVKYSTAFGDRTLALTYVQVPVMVQFYPVKEFYLEFGPQLGFLAGANIKDSSNNKTDVLGDYNKINLSISLGAGFKATKELGFYVRYNAGLTDITANNNSINNSNVVQLGTAIRLN